ncbi:beta-galactosidase [Rikenella microfusus]|uniref:beta-galactosidase n=1 Tax=Rikenella microfusus TaxID=28139 RepID=UPI003A930F15
MRKYLLLCVTAMLLVTQGAWGKRFEVSDGKFLLDGKSVQLICGEMHYPRIPKEYWADRMRRAKAMGLNTVSAYVFWNYHERQPGEFDFSGQADLAEFVRTAQREGLFVLLRPGPYVCAEWDFGGYPYWLLKDKDMEVRSKDPKFLAACKRYIDRLGKELAPLTIENGGPIIMVQVENEYGSYSDDKEYLAAIRDMLKEAGFNVPLITCDGAGQMPNGYVDGALPTVNGAVGEDIIRSIDRFHKGGPYFVAEFYPAWFDVWGDPHSYRDYHGPVKQLEWMLEHGVSISLYMFHGGTNFEYTNGANTNTPRGYDPQPTSYDYDAPLGEWGNAYPKYVAFREMIRRHLPEGTTLPDVPANNPVAGFAEISLEECAPLSAAFGRRVESDTVLTMEDLDQDFGYIHYETTIDSPVKGMLEINDLRDYAVVLVDGKQVGSLDRRHRQNRLPIEIAKAPARLEILVENVGRVNYGPDILNNRKGITRNVVLDGKELRGWTITPLPLYKAETGKFKFRPGDLTGQPAFFRGTFVMDSVGDCFVDTRGWGKGAVWVNGRSLGKYWNIGPQQTMYLPAPWLKKGKNEIVVFAMENTGKRTVRGLTQPILDSLGDDPNAVRRPKRDMSKTPIMESGDIFLRGTMAQQDGWQTFGLDNTVTLRHLGLEVLSSYDDAHSCLSELELLDADGKPLKKDAWKVVYVDTEETKGNEGYAEHLFDGDPKTYWHSQWQGKRKAFPHRVIIDLGEISTVGSVRLRQRDPKMAGNVKDFVLYGRPQFFLFE